jgi:hypothetical protein
MAFFMFFIAPAPAGAVPAPDNRGKLLAVAIIPTPLFFHKQSLFMELSVLFIKGGKLHKSHAIIDFGIIYFDNGKPQPCCLITGLYKSSFFVKLPIRGIPGFNEIINILVEKGGIPGSHQLFRCLRYLGTGEVWPATGSFPITAFATAKFFLHSFLPFTSIIIGGIFIAYTKPAIIP